MQQGGATVRLTEGEAKDIWERMLDAQADTIFWGRMLRSRRTIDLWLTIVILAFSLGPILSLHFFVQHPYKLQMVLAAIAVLSIIQVVLGLASAANDMVNVHVECTTLYTRYDLLWGDLEHLPPDQARAEFRQLKLKAAEIDKLCVKLPTNKRIYKQCFGEVCKARGLDSPI